MNYSLEVHELAEKEIKKFNKSVKNIFFKKLKSALENPHREANRLSGFQIPTYKIKSGAYRLVYEVHDDRIVVIVLCIGIRANNQVYELARYRGKQ